MVVRLAYSGSLLDELPDLRAEAVGPLDGVEVERESAGMGDVDVVEGDPEKARREAAHELARDKDRELVGADQVGSVGHEIIDRELEDRAIWSSSIWLPARLGGVERRLVVVAQEMLVARAIGPRGEGGARRRLGRITPAPNPGP